MSHGPRFPVKRFANMDASSWSSDAESTLVKAACQRGRSRVGTAHLQSMANPTRNWPGSNDAFRERVKANAGLPDEQPVQAAALGLPVASRGVTARRKAWRASCMSPVAILLGVAPYPITKGGQDEAPIPHPYDLRSQHPALGSDGRANVMLFPEVGQGGTA